MHHVWSSIEEALYFFKVICQISRSHMTKNRRFWLEWVLQDYNWSLNSLMASKWFTKLDVVLKKCLFVFQGHLLNFQVTRDRKSLFLTRIERFQTVTPVWIHQWIWNDAQSWCCIEEVPYCSFMSFIKYQGHTGWKIDDLNPILSKITRLVAAIKSLGFTLFFLYWDRTLVNFNFCRKIPVINYWFITMLTGGIKARARNFRSFTVMPSRWFFFTQGQFWPSGIVITCVCVCPCVCMSVCASITCLSAQ